MVVIPTSHAQKIKYGNIPSDQLKMQVCPFDDEAGAVVLSDVGEAWMQFDASGRLMVMADRHVRVKILNSTGYDYGNVQIPFYSGLSGDADISGLKAQTIIPSGNKYETVKVEKSAIFEEKTNDYNTTVKFSFPKVDDGVIVEYKYRIESRYFQPIRNWYFQRRIPVMFTKFEAIIPDFFDCSVNVVGHHSDAVSYNRTTRTDDNWLNNIHQFEGSNVPALKKEKYGTNIRNYTTKCRIAIRSYQFPGRFIEKVGGSYTEFNKTLLESDQFRQIDQKLKFLDDDLALVQRSDTEYEDIGNIVQHVRTQVNFNSYHDFSSRNSVKATMNGEASNSGAVNLYLTMLLRHAGYEVEPLILGTRGYRRPHPFDPTNMDFNHLVALVTDQKGKSFLVDATSDLPNGQPKISVFNAQGWVISSTKPRKVDLSQIGVAKIMVKSNLALEPEGSSAQHTEIRSNYLGLHALSDGMAYTADNYEKYLKDDKGFALKEFSETSSGANTTIAYSCPIEDLSAKKFLYVTPAFEHVLDYDIFKNEIRNTPLDIPYRINLTNIIDVPIPEGYVVESMPESRKYTLGDDEMKFSILFNHSEEKIMINMRFKVNKNFYLQDAYPDIRAFVGEIENTLNEKIVFKQAN